MSSSRSLLLTLAATLALVASLSSAAPALVLGTCFESPDGRRYNAQRFYDRDGAFLGFHAKILLCRRMSDPEAKAEIDGFQTRPLRTFMFAGTTVGGLICNDVWANPEWTPMDDPHLTHRLAGMGAQLIFVSANTGRTVSGEALALSRNDADEPLFKSEEGRTERWNALSPTRCSISARTKRVGDNALHLEMHRLLHAPSGIVAPDGTWTLRIESPGEQLFVHTIDLDPS